jgi:CheY-like chemotaxis protein
MSNLVRRVVTFIRHGQAYELVGALLAAWGQMERADRPSDVARAVEQGADLVVVESQLWGELDTAVGPRLRARREAGQLRVVLLGERPAAAGLGPPIDAVVPANAPVSEVLRLLNIVVFAHEFDEPHTWEVPATLETSTGEIPGRLERTRKTSATFRSWAAVPAGLRGTLRVEQPERSVSLPCACSGGLRSRDGFLSELELELEGAYRLWMARAAPVVSGRPRLLVVDDSELVNRITESVLSRAGFEVRCITNPLQLAARAAEWKPALVLVDYNIPLLAGDKVVELSRVAGVKAPMVLYSSAPVETLATVAARARAFGFISKRVAPEELVRQVRGVLEAAGRAN